MHRRRHRRTTKKKYLKRFSTTREGHKNIGRTQAQSTIHSKKQSPQWPKNTNGRRNGSNNIWEPPTTLVKSIKICQTERRLKLRNRSKRPEGAVTPGRGLLLNNAGNPVDRRHPWHCQKWWHFSAIDYIIHYIDNRAIFLYDFNKLYCNIDHLYYLQLQPRKAALCFASFRKAKLLWYQSVAMLLRLSEYLPAVWQPLF